MQKLLEFNDAMQKLFLLIEVAGFISFAFFIYIILCACTTA